MSRFLNPQILVPITYCAVFNWTLRRIIKNWTLMDPITPYLPIPPDRPTPFCIWPQSTCKNLFYSPHGRCMCSSHRVHFSIPNSSGSVDYRLVFISLIAIMHIWVNPYHIYISESQFPHIGRFFFFCFHPLASKYHGVIFNSWEILLCANVPLFGQRSFLIMSFDPWKLLSLCH